MLFRAPPGKPAMLKIILAVTCIVCATMAPSTGKAQVYSPEKISVAFSQMSRMPVQFLECKGKICIFQLESPLAAVIFMANNTEQGIRMLSVTFHSSKAQVASVLMREALRFAQYPELDDIDVKSLMAVATSAGKDVEIKKGLGLKLIKFVNVDKNVFSFRFYRVKDGES